MVEFAMIACGPIFKMLNSDDVNEILKSDAMTFP